MKPQLITILCKGREPTILKWNKTIIGVDTLMNISKYAAGLMYTLSDGTPITILANDGDVELVHGVTTYSMYELPGL